MSSFTLLEVAGVMSKTVVTIDVSKSVLDAIKKMKKNDIGSLVVKNKKECIGLVTERGLLFDFYAEGRTDGDTVKLKEFVNTKIDTIAPGESIFEARELMVDKHIEYLLVMDGEDIVGIVSQHDLLK